jgi:hypothetical protein
MTCEAWMAPLVLFGALSRAGSIDAPLRRLYPWPRVVFSRGLALRRR